jgi:hypothetical protein
MKEIKKEIREEEREAQRQREREAWRASFDHDPIDLRRLPRHIVEKTRAILERIADGATVRDLEAKRMQYDRQFVSVVVTREYRLVCLDTEAGLQPVEALSHEDYNTRYAGGNRR